MQVILLEDVKSLGKKGEIVKVNDGYARNYILPKKLGLEATPKNLNDLKLQKTAEAKKQQEIYEEAVALKEKIEALTVNLTIKTGEGGRTFGSISTKEIVEGLKKQHAMELDKKKLVMADSIKGIGTYHVSVKLHAKVTAELKVRVDGQ